MKVGSYLPSFHGLLAEIFTIHTSPKLVHSLSKHLFKVLLSISGVKTCLQENRDAISIFYFQFQSLTFLPFSF